MKRFCQIQNNVVWWIFEAEELPEFAPNIQLIDITDEKYEGIKEGWLYNEETKTFIEPQIPTPLPPQPTLEELAEETLLETKYQTTLLELNNA